MAWADDVALADRRARRVPARVSIMEGELWVPLGELFETYDALICPTWAVTGIPAGDSLIGQLFDDGGPNDRQFTCFMTTPFNVFSAVPGAGRAERRRAVQRRADGHPDRRAHLRRRHRVPDRRRAGAGAAVDGIGALARVSLRDRLQALVDADVSAWPTMPARLLVRADARRRRRGGRRRRGSRDGRAARAGLAIPDRQRDEAVRRRGDAAAGRRRSPLAGRHGRSRCCPVRTTSCCGTAGTTPRRSRFAIC